MDAARKSRGIPCVSTRFSLSMRRGRLTRDGTTELSRDHILRRVRGHRNINFPHSADHEQNWQTSPVDPYSISDGHTSILCVCVCFLPLHSGLQWTYQPGPHRKKVTQDFPSPFFSAVLAFFFSREGSCHSFPSLTVKSNFVY